MLPGQLGDVVHIKSWHQGLFKLLNSSPIMQIEVYRLEPGPNISLHTRDELLQRHCLIVWLNLISIQTRPYFQWEEISFDILHQRIIIWCHLIFISLYMPTHIRPMPQCDSLNTLVYEVLLNIIRPHEVLYSNPDVSFHFSWAKNQLTLLLSFSLIE